MVVAMMGLGLVMGASCQDDPDPGPTPTSLTTGADGPAPPQAYDPPSHFDLSGGTLLPNAAKQGKVTLGGDVLPPLPVALYGTTAYVAAPDGLVAVDALSGQLVGAMIRPQAGSAEPYVTGENFTEPPLVTNVDGADLVVVPFVVDVPGQGTTPGRKCVELVAVEAATAEIAWRTLVELEPWADASYLSTVTAVPVGVHERTAVIRVSTSSDDVATYGVDLVGRQVTWTGDGFAGYAVAGGTAVGTVGLDKYGLGVAISGVSVGDGTTVWTSPRTASRLTISEGGPSLVVVTGMAGDGFIRLVDAASGASRLDSAGNYTGIGCQYDDMSVIVCRSGSFSPVWAAAFDSTSGRLLWSLPDTQANRVAPEVTSAWHGAVYGKTENGPVVLDGRTGADREDQPGAAPYVVNGYVGVGIADSGRDEALAYAADG